MASKPGTFRRVDSNETNQVGTSDVITSSRDKIKPLYLYCYSDYDHQTWQDGDQPCAASTHNVTLPFVYVILRDHVTT